MVDRPNRPRQPYPLAVDVDVSTPHPREEPFYLQPPPSVGERLFQLERTVVAQGETLALIRTDLLAYRGEVTRKLSAKKKWLAVAKYAGTALGAALAANPHLAKLLPFINLITGP